MVHSGSCTGKKWQIVVYEKVGANRYPVFDSGTKFREKMVRPQKVIDLLEDYLLDNDTFNYENHAMFVVNHWFSLKSISRGFEKISRILNEPLVFKGEKE